ncbi:hypothetical protein DFJ74DRAFT_712395 [Hyaloraphidium curvatum]|nr:hypothetical protein DFJ74DRAFT_712395 [Hyaloraphidium curvatum]
MYASAPHLRRCRRIALAKLKARAASGDPNALHDLALRMWTGDGMRRQAAEALALWERIANDDHVPAIMQLYRMHFYGRPRRIQRNFETARRWLLKAAELGHVTAQVWLGDLYYDGTGGVPADKAAAALWFEKAAAQGSHYAGRMLCELRRAEPSPTPIAA